MREFLSVLGDALILLIVGIVVWAIYGYVVAASAAERFDASRYCPVAWDREFRAATRTFMPPALRGDWLRPKAHALQESSCRPHVCSSAGACGVLQLLPTTWEHQTRAIRETGSIFEPRANIRTGTSYLGWLCRQWARRGRSASEIGDLCAASYISGLGNILRAQARCDDARLWPDIEQCLWRVIAPSNAIATAHYVARIRWWRGRLRSHR